MDNILIHINEGRVVVFTSVYTEKGETCNANLVEVGWNSDVVLGQHLALN